MIVSLAGRGVRTVLLDIEGTTTPIAFVHEVLFPYARARLDAWWTEHDATPIARELAAALEAEHARDLAGADPPPPWSTAHGADRRTSAVRYIRWLMDRDRKSPPLKRLQGLIWDEGYRRGDLRGELFPDVAPALRRWRAEGVDAAIYSSGSELAQRRLFGSAAEGDLTRLITAFFDTRIGSKRDAASYVRIAAALGRKPATILFISDVAAELRAAESAGCPVALSVRPGNAPETAPGVPVVPSLDEIG